MLNETELQEIEKLWGSSDVEGFTEAMYAHWPALLSTVREQRDLIEEQRRTIQSLMMGVEEHTGKDGTTSVLRYIEELEQQNADLRAELDGDDLPLRDKLKMAENLVEELQRQVQEREAEIYRLCDELKGEQTYG